MCKTSTNIIEANTSLPWSKFIISLPNKTFFTLVQVIVKQCSLHFPKGSISMRL